MFGLLRKKKLLDELEKYKRDAIHMAAISINRTTKEYWLGKESGFRIAQELIRNGY